MSATPIASGSKSRVNIINAEDQINAVVTAFSGGGYGAGGRILIAQAKAAENNVIIGTPGDDTLTGTSGDDIFIGGAGADALDGGAGSDTASYSTATEGVTIFMAWPERNTGDALGDSFISIENLTGSAFDDLFSGMRRPIRLRAGRVMMSCGAAREMIC